MQPRGEYTAESEMNHQMTAAPKDEICHKCRPKQNHYSNTFKQPSMLTPRINGGREGGQRMEGYTAEAKVIRNMTAPKGLKYQRTRPKQIDYARVNL